MITKESRDVRYRLRLNIHCRETGHLLEDNPAIYFRSPIDTKKLLAIINQDRIGSFGRWCFDTKEGLIGIRYPQDGMLFVAYETAIGLKHERYNPTMVGDILIPLLELSPTFHDLCVTNEAGEEIIPWRKVW
jgi:hypothetical protein